MNAMKNELPGISVVIIGLNVEKTIRECIASISGADYPDELLEILYVDGGSNDNSVALAQSFKDVKIIELKDPHPTPGRGRNAGYKSSSCEYIQFVDADSYIDPVWFKNALAYFSDDTAAVCGSLKERFPNKNIYHIVSNIEWGVVSAKKGWFYEEGPVRIFGGNVLVKRESLDKTNGFDESLIAGEDPDLSYRIRQYGWEIYRIHALMATHDININSFGQYFKRSFRSGYAFGSLCLKYIGKKEKMYLREFIRGVLGALTPFILIVMGTLFNQLTTMCILVAILFAFRPFLKIIQFRKKYYLTLQVAFLYALHLSFIVYPQFFGALRYIVTLIGVKPLLNKGYKPLS